MHYELWDFGTNVRLTTFADEIEAMSALRRMLADNLPGLVNRLGLVTVGGPTLTYPLEGAALLAKVFGLEES